MNALEELKTADAEAAEALTAAHAHIGVLEADRVKILERRATAARLVTQAATDREVAVRSRENGTLTADECAAAIADALTLGRAAGVELETTSDELRIVDESIASARQAIPQAEAARNQAEVAVYAEVEKLEVERACTDLSAGLARLRAALELCGAAGAFASTVNRIATRAQCSTTEIAREHGVSGR